MSDTKTVSGNIVHIQDKGAPTALSVIVNINPKQSGSGTPSPDNVRAISGWESVNVGVNKKNFLPLTAQSKTTAGITFTVNEDGSITANGTATANAVLNLYASTNGVFSLANGTYTITGCPSGGSASTYRIWFENKAANGSTNVNAAADQGNGANLAITYGKARAYITVANGATVNNVVFRPMIRLTSDTDPTFAPYTGATTTTDLGRTVYGGTLDVVTGVLTVDKVGVDMGTLNWTFSSGNNCFAVKPTPEMKQNGLIQCSCYKTASTIASANDKSCGALYFNWLAVKDSSYTDASAFKTSVSGQYMVYPLATPQTYTLTGQNVNLLKDCYAWADSGDISITYETYLINGLFHKIWINGVKMFAPNDFTLERSDVYAGEITTCTGKTIADRIGWKYADMSLNWDYLPQEYLETILNLSGVFTITFENEEGVQFTEQCIRKGSTMTGTRFTDNAGNMMWKGVQFDISFINVHN